MAFIDDQQRVVRQIVEQTRRRLPRLPARQIARIVLDAGAVADLLHHFHVEHGALLEPLRLQQLAGVTQVRESHTQILADLVDGTDQALPRGHVVRSG